MSTLQKKIFDKIKTEGHISFETFMEMALYHPNLGYYMRNDFRIGKEGDYYTSSHLHPIFGEMLGRQIEEMCILLGNPKTFHIVEMGAGKGYLAKDILEYLNRNKKLNNFRYFIVEINPSYREFQKNLLLNFKNHVSWFSKIRNLPPIRGCFLSNELLDSFPVRLVEFDGNYYEINLSLNKDEKIIETRLSCPSEIIEYFEEFSIDLSSMQPYRTEVNLRIKDWLKEINKKLLEGFIVTIDYGYPAYEYYSEERNRGTLLCYHNHKIVENPYINIGEQDITAHINFSALDKWGNDLGLKTLGFCSQGSYLVSMGIHEVIAELYSGRIESFEIAKIKGLIFPVGMGDSHKVLIQYKGDGIPQLKGFTIRNLKDKL
ncbi:MAG: SAM-dependent methyltransferase [Thermodesulfovibrionales bacterium]|nr:SAM-dependent methyltransferase [Thermodesulfovibrionales bacterium]